MTRSNVVDFASHRNLVHPEEAAARASKRHADRVLEAIELLDTLRRKKRVLAQDRSLLRRNLGHLISSFENSARKTVTKRVLEDKFAKRKRYVQFAGEAVYQSCAASGGDFARIIDQLIAEKVRLGIAETHAKIEIVHEALRGTSLRRPSRFEMPDGLDDTAFLLQKIDRVLNVLAQDVDLGEFFELVSKYPIFPWYSQPGVSSSKQLLVLRSGSAPNDLYEWHDYLDEDELQTWVPWWAPKCVIGHLYIPFICHSLELPEGCIAKLRHECKGQIASRYWNEECSWLLEPYLNRSELRQQRTVHHRLPVWLVILPSSSGLTFYLYASVHYWDDFQWNETAINETWLSHFRSITPCFIDGLGKLFDDDAEYFSDDAEYDPYYISATRGGVTVIGSRVDTDISDFVADLSNPWINEEELPSWLHAHPVQRLLKLAAGGDAAAMFALSTREFTNMKDDWPNLSGSLFRPAFPDPLTKHTPLMQNTIGAYLLRSFVNSGEMNVFEALKNDALAKYAAAKDLINGELSKFQTAFDQRYGK